MAKFRPDFRKILREIATRAQDENADRLLSGASVDGGSLAPRVDHVAASTKGRSKRIRLFGIRVRVRELTGHVGVKTGEMLRDLTKRSNIKIGRVSFKIVPSPGVRVRMYAFAKGVERGNHDQPARPFSGMTGALLEEARARIAQEARDQIAEALNDRRGG